MAKFGVDVTNMSGPSLAGASHVASGIVDKSAALRVEGMATDIANVGTMAKDAYTGYNMADVEKEQEATIQEYMDRRDPTQLAIEAAGLKDAELSLWKQPGVTDEELDPVLAKYNETLSRYQKAHEQGIMSADEFANRTLANLRNAVNRNPQLYNDLASHSSKVLELSGITGIVKADALKQKTKADEADAMIKNVHSRADRLYVPYSFNEPIDMLEEKVKVAEKNEQSYRVWTQSKAIEKDMDEKQAISWVERNGDGAVRGAISNFQQTVLKLAGDNQISATEFPKVKAQFTIEAEKAKSLFTSSIPAKLRGNPEIVRKIEDFNKGIDNTVEMLDKLGSGEDWKKALANQVDITNSIQTAEVQGRVNRVEVDMMSRVLQANPGLAVTDEGVRAKMKSTLLAVYSDTPNAPDITKNLPKNMNDTTLSNHLVAGAKLGRETGDWSAYNKIADSYTKVNPENPYDKYMFLSKNLDTIAKQDFTGADAQVVSSTTSMIDAHLNNPRYGIPSLMSNMVKYKGNTPDILPDGRIVFTGPDAAAFNNKFGTQINTSLIAYSKVNNMSTKEAARYFYPKFFGAYGLSLENDKDLQK